MLNIKGTSLRTARSSSRRCDVSNRMARTLAVQKDSISLAQGLSSVASASLLAAALLSAPITSMLLPQPAWADDSEISRRAVDEYQEAESKGKTKNVKDLEGLRGKYRIRRQPDGRVQLKSSRGEWWSVRLDMEVSRQSALMHCFSQVSPMQKGWLWYLVHLCRYDLVYH